MTEEYLFRRQRVVVSRFGEWVSLATLVVGNRAKVSTNNVFQMHSPQIPNVFIASKALRGDTKGLLPVPQILLVKTSPYSQRQHYPKQMQSSSLF